MSKSKGYIICLISVFIILLFLGHNKAKGSLSHGIDTDWWSKVQEDIKESEYEISWQEKHSEYQSPNRAQNLRFSYYHDGFKVRPRIEGDKWSIDIRLKKYGHKNEMLLYKCNNISIGKRKAKVLGNGINIEFENGKKGMREDFIVERKGKGRGNLILEFDVSNHNVKMVAKENEINFVMDESGGVEILRYSDMEISDNRGKILKGYFKSIDDNRFAIVVDDRDSEYPIRIDPLSQVPNWTAESNQIGACFGSSVSTAGDVNGDGYSDVIVGAPFYDNGEVDEGRAYVYYGSVSGLSSTPDWTGESDQVDVYFGVSVSTAGDINGDGYSDVIIGADCYTNGHSEEGIAYVYYGSASGLSQTPDWTAESNQEEEDANFGWSVSTAGDVNGDGYSDVIVGAYRYDNGETNEGRAYVYYGSVSGLSSTPDWTGESDQADAYFGTSVSTAGDVNGDGYSDVIIGAYYYDNGETNEGRAYVYYGSLSGLSSTPDWTGESDQTDAYFGTSVSTAGDVNGDGYSDVIIGAYRYDNGEQDEGMAYIYYGSVSGLSLIPDWTGESNQAQAYFGNSVSFAGDVNGDGYSDVIVGAPNYDNDESSEGRAYVYYGSAEGLSQTPDWTGESNQVYAFFGTSVSTAGDVNGDGYSDVIVGANWCDNGHPDEGMAFVYYGSSEGLSSTPDWSGESNQPDANFGFSVSTAGDVNGDGYSDVIVGAPYCGEMSEGMAFVYYGSADGLSQTPDWSGEPNQPDANFGTSVSKAGDVNGDGYSDVIVGAPNTIVGDPNYDSGKEYEGKAFVYYGSSSGLSLLPDWTVEANHGFTFFGHSVSTAGDVNGDGYSDVIVGAPLHEDEYIDGGGSFVYYGSVDGLSQVPDWAAGANQENALFGNSVSTAGDVNGDGYSDVIIGAYYYDNDEVDEGRAFVYYGSVSGLSSTPDWTGESDQAGARFGYSVSTAGDVNSDGYSDVIVGAYHYDNGEENEGRAFVYYGSVSGLSQTPDWTAESNQAGSQFGTSVSTAGDINGDGYSDVIVFIWLKILGSF
jgi:hypothetical protein